MDINNLTPMQLTGLLQMQGAVGGAGQRNYGLQEGTQLFGLLQQQQQAAADQQRQGLLQQRADTKWQRGEAAYEAGQAALDPNSATSQRAREQAATIYPNLDTTGMSAADVAKMIPQWASKIEADAKAEDRRLRQEQTAATQAATEAYRSADLSLKQQAQQARIDKQKQDMELKRQEAEATAAEAEIARTEKLASIDTTIDMFESALTELEKGNVETGQIVEFFAPMSKDNPSLFEEIGIAIRSSLDPEIEVMTQVQARLDAEAKQLYDLGVMSADDWKKMQQMSVSPGKSEDFNKGVLRTQLDILKGSRKGYVSGETKAADVAPVTPVTPTATQPQYTLEELEAERQRRARANAGRGRGRGPAGLLNR